MNYRPGGVIHAYQKYDPAQFPPPAQPPPDMVSPAFEQALRYGNYRELTEEELARAIRLDPSQIAGLGPSLDMLRECWKNVNAKFWKPMKRKSVQKKARKAFQNVSKNVHLPRNLQPLLQRAVVQEQPFLIEQLWYRCDDDNSDAARGLMQIAQRMSDKHNIEELASKYDFRRQRIDVDSQGAGNQGGAGED